jgi:hypothetical protein
MTGDASAQIDTFTVNVPFDFNVGDERLQAGKYQLKMAMPGVLQISGSNRDGTFAITMPRIPKTTPTQSKLVFRTYGDAVYLAQIFWIGWSTGREIIPTKEELRMARTASTGTRTLLVTRAR